MIPRQRVYLLGSQQVTQLGLAILIERDPQLVLVGRGMARVEALAEVPAAMPDIVCIGVAPGERVTALALSRELSRHSAVVICTEPAAHLTADAAASAGALGVVASRDGLDQILAAVHSAARGRRRVSAALRGAGPHPQLSGRQRQVLRLFADGLSTDDVACALGISGDTVKAHTKAVMRRLGVSARPEAVAVALRRGLIS